ncbi:MAG: thiol:disulfide interchange protein DsbA/DsbL [Pseudomonadales bacterium]
MKRILATLLLLSAPLLSLSAQAQATAEKYTAGKDYQVISVPVHTANPDKIEVNEVFWYGCPHCYTFEAALEPWAKKLASDVDYQRTPAIWRPAMEIHARAYYAAKQLGNLDAMHSIIFKAMQDEKKALANENEVVALFVNHGTPEADIRKAYNSFSVQSQARQADARARSYGVQGTPEIVVNGKYRISTADAGSQENMLKVADFLIAKERSNKK